MLPKEDGSGCSTLLYTTSQARGHFRRKLKTSQLPMSESSAKAACSRRSWWAAAGQASVDMVALHTAADYPGAPTQVARDIRPEDDQSVPSKGSGGSGSRPRS